MASITTKTRKKRTKKVAFYGLYLLACNKMLHYQKPNLKTLQRSLRPSCKTTLLDDSILCLKLKNETHGVIITFENESYTKGVYYYTVISS